MKFDKHQQVFLRRKLDLRKTGGPLLPKGSPMTIQKSIKIMKIVKDHNHMKKIVKLRGDNRKPGM